MKKSLFIFLISAIIMVSCTLTVKFCNGQGTSPKSPPSEIKTTELTTSAKKKTVNCELLCKKLKNCGFDDITPELLSKMDNDSLQALSNALKSNNTDNLDWHEITGYTYNAIIDKFGGGTSIDMGFNGKTTFTVGFTGDINFTEHAYVMPHAYTKPNVVLDCIDEVFLNEMKTVDIMMVNNEFTYSNRGEPTPNKKYTFRAKPENVKYLTSMGVDLVSLANNHTFDYGYDSFTDTIETLNNEGIAYVGAGMNFTEASSPVCFIQNGYKIAFLASSGVESPIYTPLATDSDAGIMGSYDSGVKLIAAIKKAKETSDYVIVYPHWGIENTTALTNAQTTLSKKYIDAGADAVIGNHPHILQGIQFYKHAPIMYSLGNFWFNTRDIYTGLAELTFGEGKTVLKFIPGRQVNSETRYISDPGQQKELYDMLIRISPSNAITIDENGIINEK